MQEKNKKNKNKPIPIRLSRLDVLELQMFNLFDKENEYSDRDIALTLHNIISDLLYEFLQYLRKQKVQLTTTTTTNDIDKNLISQFLHSNKEEESHDNLDDLEVQ